MLLFSLDSLVYYLQLIVFILVSVAFLTLLERKILSYGQLRKGPNKLGIFGILQPFADALKLFSKEEAIIFSVNTFFFFISPFLGMFVALVVWMCMVSFSGFIDFKYSLIFFLLCVSVSVYSVIFSGWSSSSKYALLGSLRAIAQTISYEIILTFVIFLGVLVYYSFNLSDVVYNQENFFFIFLGVHLFFIMFITCVAETNRAPLDLAEGESELVSGFNVEYGGFKFALIFMAEYMNIIWMSMFMSLFFFGSFVFFLGLLFIIIFLLLRASYPRMRYDFLMMLMWKSLLMVVLIMFLYLFLFVN